MANEWVDDRLDRGIFVLLLLKTFILFYQCILCILYGGSHKIPLDGKDLERECNIWDMKSYPKEQAYL